MSNLEREPEELTCSAELSPGIQILEPRQVPLGGSRALDVRRTLPQRGRSLIGSWCFADHYRSESEAESGGMIVPPHPHTELQTVSWLFFGEIEHRDSTCAHALLHPGELGLMTAGRGVQHSEVSPPTTRTLSGVQFWIALPESARHTDPHFEHYVPPVAEFPEGRVSVFLGSLLGQQSTATTFSPLVGAQIDLHAGQTFTVPVEASFEHGVLVDTGEVTVAGALVPPSHLAYLGVGHERIELTARTESRFILIGGAPLNEEFVMWWNFISRSHDEIVDYRSRWQSEVVGGGTDAGHFGIVRGYSGAPLPAPPMPTVRLKSRG